MRFPVRHLLLRHIPGIKNKIQQTGDTFVCKVENTNSNNFTYLQMIFMLFNLGYKYFSAACKIFYFVFS